MRIGRILNEYADPKDHARGRVEYLDGPGSLQYIGGGQYTNRGAGREKGRSKKSAVLTGLPPLGRQVTYGDQMIKPPHRGGKNRGATGNMGRLKSLSEVQAEKKARKENANNENR